jgi:hypothetical protein
MMEQMLLIIVEQMLPFSMMINDYSDHLAEILELMHRWVRYYEKECEKDSSQAHSLQLKDELMVKPSPSFPNTSAVQWDKDKGGCEAGRRSSGYSGVAQEEQEGLIGSHQWPVITQQSKAEQLNIKVDAWTACFDKLLGREGNSESSSVRSSSLASQSSLMYDGGGKTNSCDMSSSTCNSATILPGHSVVARTESRTIALKAGAGKGRAIGSSLPSGRVRNSEAFDMRPTTSTTLASSADVVAAVLGGAAFASPRPSIAQQAPTSVANQQTLDLVTGDPALAPVPKDPAQSRQNMPVA